MLGSHLDGLRSCLDDGCTSPSPFFFLERMDEHCIGIRRTHWFGMCGQTITESRHQHVLQWVEMVSRILTSRSREGQAKLGGMAGGAGDIRCRRKNPFTRNRTRDHLISAKVYSQMLYQLSYERCYWLLFRLQRCAITQVLHTPRRFFGPSWTSPAVEFGVLPEQARRRAPPSLFFFFSPPGTCPRY